MTSIPALQLPPPADWQEFERLCCDLWRRIWDDPNAQLNGREGQPQHGVDVFGQPQRGGKWAGVQCKLRSQLKERRLSGEDIRDEVKKARRFNPSLAEFIVATTAERDATAQLAAREITEVHEEQGLFSVTVFAWEDIVLRLAEHKEVLEKYYPDLSEGRADRDAIRIDYLATLFEQLYPVPLLGVGRSGSRDDIPLAAVYTALDTRSEETVLTGRRLGDLEGYRAHLEQRLRQEALARESGADEPYTRALTAVETAAAHPRLVLLGPAGSGKSTFGRYLALCLAGEALKRREANLETLEGPAIKTKGDALPAWTHGALLPVFVELRKFVRSDAFPAEGKAGKADDLLAYLGACGKEKIEAAGILKEGFAHEGRALLILDGLDETPAVTESRKRLKQAIVSFCRRYPQCRVLVTCRPYAYEAKSPWRLDGEDFVEESLRPFDAAKRRAFISGGRLPGSRAGLYEESVKLLLDRWNEVRDVLGGQSLSEHLGMGDKEVRQALESSYRDRAILKFYLYMGARIGTGWPACWSPTSTMTKRTQRKNPGQRPGALEAGDRHSLRLGRRPPGVVHRARRAHQWSAVSPAQGFTQRRAGRPRHEYDDHVPAARGLLRATPWSDARERAGRRLEGNALHLHTPFTPCDDGYPTP